jgi:hypothetical protein
MVQARVREVTSDEVAHFRTHGWVKLPGLFSPDAVACLLERARARMGEVPMTIRRIAPHDRIPNEYNWYARWDGPSHLDPWIRELSHSRELASASARLMQSRDYVRFYFDHVFVKLPVSHNGSKTPWHQDLPHHPLDRHGVLTIWVALLDCPPEMGTMRFLSGSHRAGLFGRYLNRNDGMSLIDEHPWVLDEFPQSEPLHLRAGDATVHDLAVIHYAPENTTGSPRWVYTSQWLPPAARYTGAPNHRTDGLDLQIDRPLDHPRMPLIPV